MNTYSDTLTASGSDELVPWLVLAAGAIGSSILLLGASDQLGLKILAMALLTLTGMAAVRFDIVHPYVWFGGAFLIYSVGGPLLENLDIHPISFWGNWRVEELDFSSAVDFAFLALLITQVVIGPKRVSLDASATDADMEIFCRGAMFVMVAALIVGLISVYEILSQGFTDKSAYVLEGGWLTRWSFGFNIVTTAGMVYLIKLLREENNRGAFLLITFFVVLGLFLVLFIGQRHFLFRVGIVVVITLHIFYYRLSQRALIMIVAGALVLGTALNGLKMAYAVQDVVAVGEFGEMDDVFDTLIIVQPELATASVFERSIKLLLLSALGSEAMTAGNNLAMVLSRVPHDLPYFQGENIFSDLARAILPGFIFADEVESTSGAYNRIVFPLNTAMGAGVGFSVVGYGYLHFGIAGVFLVMTILATAIRAIYHWAGRRPMGLLFFIAFLPVAITSSRTELAGPLSQGIKHVLLPLVLMLTVSALSSRPTAGAERRAVVDRRAQGSGPSRILHRERRQSATERRDRTDRRLGPRTSRKDRGRFPELTQGEPKNT